MSKRHLLFSVTIRDCRVDTFTVGGNGGSGKDTSNTGVRVVHSPSGATGECREHRSQARNKQIAFRRMGESKTFRSWAQMQATRIQTGKSIEQRVGEWMQPEHLKLEVRDEHGKWVEAPPTSETA